MAVAKVILTNDDGTTQELDAVPAFAPLLVSGDRYFPAQIIEAAQASHKKFWPKGPFVSVNLAQWADESAYGKAKSGLNNYFGIKANAEQIAAGAYSIRTTKEQTADGRYYTIKAKFANYASLADCFDAHAVLLTSPHYAPCMNAQTPIEYCRALHECGYATENDYADILISIIKAHNLTQYDQRF